MATNLRQLVLTGLSLAGAISVASGYACTYQGQGSSVCRLDVVQDVWVERSYTNYNDRSYLIAGKEWGYPLKRTLLQFEDLDASNDCTTITDAYMYVYFEYAHKPSAQTSDQTPYITHDLQLHVVNKPWLEDEATSTKRLSGAYWDSTLLALDGTDAESSVLASQIMPMAGPGYRWIMFKVTDAVKDWADGTKDNNGLLMKVAEEDVDSRNLHFNSNTGSNPAFINVICT